MNDAEPYIAAAAHARQRTGLSSALDQIQDRNEQLRQRYGYVGGLLTLADAKDDVPRLIAAVEAVLELADEWEQEAAKLDASSADLARTPGPGSYLVSGRAQALEDCARELREAVRSRVASKEADSA